MKFGLFLALFLPLAALAEDFRGAWIASVFNINFTTSEGLSSAAQ
jgi:hypothetical protein